MIRASNSHDDPLGFRYYKEMKMDDDDGGGGDDADIPLHVVIKMAISSLPIPPSETKVLPSG